MTAFARRDYAGGGAATTLASSMSSTDTTFTVSAATGWPGSPGVNFLVVIDRDTASEEKILCSSNSGTTVTVAGGLSGRGADGTAATTHNANAQVFLCAGAIDLDEANQITNLLGNAASGALFLGAGAGTLPTKLAVGSNGGVLASVAGAPAWSAAGTSPAVLQSAGSSVPVWTVLPGTVLASVQYDPATRTAYTASASTTVVDATNLKVVFTAPPSGNVFFSFDCACETAVSSTAVWGTVWNIGGSAELSAAYRSIIGFNTGSSNNLFRLHYEVLVTGLTAGTSYTFGPGFGGSSNLLFFAGDTSTATGGPFLVKVVAA